MIDGGRRTRNQTIVIYRHLAGGGPRETARLALVARASHSDRAVASSSSRSRSSICMMLPDSVIRI
jgi:hypothetical protein